MKTRTTGALMAVTAAVGALLMPGVSPSVAVSGPNSLPVGDLPGWRQVWAENFNGAVSAPVPAGAFSGCNNAPDTPAAYCSGLRGKWRDTLWAYPAGWDDTARSGNDGNTGAPFGGTYQPQKTISIGRGYDGGGTLKVRMYRPSAGGSNVVGAVVPRRCMDLRDGRYSARVRVTQADRGFKSAWLRYEGSPEVDYPEVDDYRDSTVSGYVHPQGWSVGTGARMTDAHTYTWERRGSAVTFYLDGKKIRSGPASLGVSSWIWQNESRIIADPSKPNRGYAVPGATATVEVTWATCYRAS